MKHKFFSRMFSTLIAMVIAVVSLTFLSAQKVSAAGINETTSYISYDYTTKVRRTYNLSEVPLASANERGIYQENRYPDTDKSVVYLDMGDIYRGTGFIVGAHYVATAAHCVFNIKNKKFVDSLRVIVCAEDADKPLLVCDAVRAHVPKIYTRNSTSGAQRDANDYGLIYVEEDLSQYGIFNLGVPTNKFLANGGAVTASGFPLNIVENGNIATKTNRYRSDGTAQIYNYYNDIKDYSGTVDRRFQATCVISGGDSGGPVYTVAKLNGKEYKTVIGIATGGIMNGTSFTGTFGVRITPNLLHFYMNNDYA